MNFHLKAFKLAGLNTQENLHFLQALQIHHKQLGHIMCLKAQAHSNPYQINLDIQAFRVY
jgi:hypothetical protein